VRLSHRLRLAVVLAAGGATLALCLTMGPLLWGTSRQLARVFDAVPPAALAACDADPRSWTWTGSHDLTAWAIDPVTRTPLSPDAPPIPVLLDLRLRLGEAEPVLVSPLHDGMLVLHRDAPCASIVVAWPASPTTRGVLFGLVALVAAVALALAGLLGGSFVVRPLLASIEALDTASRAVGRATYTPPIVDDEMAAVRAALDEAHARVLAERERLVDERRDLERHLADVAHDLRSPLTALQLRLERLVATPDDTAAIRGAIADVAYLGLLTENLATTGQLRRGLLPRAGTADLCAIAQRVADRFRRLAEQSGLELVAVVPDEPVEVPGPEVYVEQAVSNLVHNAIRHHDGTGTVVVHVEPAPFLVVVDDGPGRVDDLPTERPGPDATHGLGLSIVRQLIAHVGGTTSITDGDPRGLVVELAWPPQDLDNPG
jgi:signal transduction histidine kinase